MFIFLKSLTVNQLSIYFKIQVKLIGININKQEYNGHKKFEEVERMGFDRQHTLREHPNIFLELIKNNSKRVSTLSLPTFSFTPYMN